MAPLNDDRVWSLHPLSFSFAVVLVVSLGLVNVYPRVVWGHLYYYLVDEDFAHGWPLVYMRRDSQIANADMGGMYHGAWPFERNPGPVRLFRFDFLILDMVAAVMLIGLTLPPIESLFQARKVPTRFSLATMLALMAIACVVLAIQRAAPWPDAVLLYWLALHLIPNCVIMLSVTLAVLSAMGGVYRRLTASSDQS